jgi:NAD(P)-dependent dehydrogenase (short-subunit alcohol dehydrogenase family)
MSQQTHHRRPDHAEQSYRGAGRLTGRHAIITGGECGIGRAAAIAYAHEGADVLISYLPDAQERAQQTLRSIRHAGANAIGIACDIRDEAQCRRIIDRAVAGFGGVDILVNYAAYHLALPGGLPDISTEQFDRVIKTNLYGTFWLCKAALPHLRPGSAIINTTSVQAFHPSADLLDYATTTAGIIAFTRALAQSLAPRGVRVNAVTLDQAGQLADAASTYVFLASSDSSDITGEVLGRPAD